MRVSSFRNSSANNTMISPCLTGGWIRGLIFLGVISLCHASEIPSNGLEGFWRFDQLKGDRAVDFSAAGRPLKLEHPQIHPESGATSSLLCDGIETYGVLDETKPLNFSNAMTLAVWILPARKQDHAPVAGRPNSKPTWTTPTTGLQLDGGRPVFGLFGAHGKLLFDGPELPMHAWSLVAVTLDGRTATMFVNGKPVATVPQTITIPASGGIPWYLGRDEIRLFQGRIGELLLWSSALDSAAIRKLWDATSGRYPLQTAKKRPWNDRTVDVQAAKDIKGPWTSYPTRLIDGIEGFVKPSVLPPVDAWGGRLDRPAVSATGFFRTERIGDRWWLVTPEGHLYFNVAVNAVHDPKNATGAVFASRATDELRDLGFNGLGNWSDPVLATVPHPLPWCLRLDFASSFAKEHGQTYNTSGHAGFNEQCIPVFHPDFPTWCNSRAAALDRTSSDPSVLGIFTDNELQCPKDLLDRSLRLDTNNPYFAPGRAAAEAWLTARGKPLDPSMLTLRDRDEFIAYVFATYARIAHDAIRAHDTNHLILGSRYDEHPTQFDNPWFWAAVGPWIDVAAVNYYHFWGPQHDDIEAWSTAMNRPVLLTEFYSKALDAPGLSNSGGAGWLVHSQSDRADYYQHFALAAMETTAVVGFHYFKYLDDPASSKNLDSAGGSNKGLYTAEGKPWAELDSSAKAVNRLAYPIIDFFDGRRAKEKVTASQQ